MKYILNAGRYALSFEIEKGGLKKTIVLDRRRLYNDTGNVATTGVTAIEDDDYKILSELEIFKKRFADKSCALSLIDEEQAMGKSDPQANEVIKENKELKKKIKELEKAQENPDAKAMKDLADENATLKAQLEALTKGKDGAPAEDSTKASEEKADEKSDEDEGF